MRENLKNTICSLADKYLEEYLENTYKKILDGAEDDPPMVKLLEQTELSLLYSSMLQEAEQGIKEALKSDGVRWSSDAWMEIEKRLVRPKFSCCDISVNQYQGKNIQEIKAKINAEKMQFVRRVAFPTVSTAVGIGTLLKKPKVMGMKTLGISFILVGGALFVKLYQEEKEQINFNVEKTKPADTMERNVSIKDILKAQYDANKEILREWFRTLEKYAGEVQEEQIKKESEE